jgi:hypothetical protein
LVLVELAALPLPQAQIPQAMQVQVAEILLLALWLRHMAALAATPDQALYWGVAVVLLKCPA